MYEETSPSLVARPLAGLPAALAEGLALPAADPLPRATAAFAQLAREILRRPRTA